MKKSLFLFILGSYIKSSFAVIPVADINVAASDTTSSAATFAAYAGYAGSIASQAQSLYNATSLVAQMQNTGGLIDALCAGCKPVTISNLKFALDNLNLELCKNFSQMINGAADRIQSMQQLQNQLTSARCSGAPGLGGAQSCLTALQMSANMVASQANSIATATQATQAAEINKKEVQSKLNNAAVTNAFGF